MAAQTQEIPNLLGAPQNLIKVAPAPVFPDRTKEAIEAQAYLAEQARIAQATSDCQAQGGTFADNACVLPPPPPAPVTHTYSVNYGYASSGLIGNMGYSTPGGNCVKEPGVNNPFNGTNPISWAVLYGSPHIGASVLFYFNHVAVVSGIYGDGSIEVRQQNSPGMSHHIYPSSIRGYR